MALGPIYLARGSRSGDHFNNILNYFNNTFNNEGVELFVAVLRFKLIYKFKYFLLFMYYVVYFLLRVICWTPSTLVEE